MHENCDCFGCRIRTINFAPSAMPSRMNKTAPRKPDPAWERGIATDERGMPYLKANSTTPMGVKEAAEKRHEIESRRRALRQS